MTVLTVENLSFFFKRKEVGQFHNLYYRKLNDIGLTEMGETYRASYFQHSAALISQR